MLEDCPLFAGLDRTETGLALRSMNAFTEFYEKNSFVHRSQTPMRYFGLVLSGFVCACTDDLEGNRMLLVEVSPGTTFGESLHFLAVEDSSVYILAQDDSLILWLSSENLFLPSDDPLANTLRKQFTALLASRTLHMNTRIQILSKHSLREKLLTYFAGCAESAHAKQFTIPFDREALAAYLGADRSAVSRALSELKRDGILDFYRNSFRILI